MVPQKVGGAAGRSQTEQVARGAEREMRGLVLLLRLLVSSVDRQDLESMESEKCSSVKCLGLCFLTCKMEAPLFCGGCMKIIHSMSKAYVTDLIIDCLLDVQC